MQASLENTAQRKVPMGFKLHLVRHGITQWNEEQRHQGHLPGIGLSVNGRNETAALGDSLPFKDYATIVSSPQQRALDTANILKDSLSLNQPVTKDERFAEWNIPIWEGLTLTEIEKSFPDSYKVYLSDPSQLKLPGAETLHEVQRRALAGIQCLQKQYLNATVLVVSHYGVISSMVCSLLGISLTSYRQFVIANSSLTVIEFLDRPILRLLNWHPSALSISCFSYRSINEGGWVLKEASRLDTFSLSL